VSGKIDWIGLAAVILVILLGTLFLILLGVVK